MKNIKYLALAFTLAGALSACGGGGGGDSSTSTFDEFFGTWQYISNSNTCELSADEGTSGKYYVINPGATVTLTLTSTSIETKRTYFSDSQCAVKAGVLTRSGTAQWSQGTLTGRSNVARVLSTFTGFKVSADGGTGITLTSVPSTSTYKFLADVVDGKLCTSNGNSAVGSDGYPTSIDTTLCLSR